MQAGLHCLVLSLSTQSLSVPGKALCTASAVNASLLRFSRQIFAPFLLFISSKQKSKHIYLWTALEGASLQETFLQMYAQHKTDLDDAFL